MTCQNFVWSASALCVAAVAAALPAASMAEDFPSHPITIVVPYNAGGAGDVMARALGKQLSAKLGQSIIVLNKPGASGMIGAAYVAR